MKCRFVKILTLYTLVSINFPSIADAPPRDRLLHLLGKVQVDESLDKFGFVDAQFRTFRDNDITSSSFGTELCALETLVKTSRIQVKDLRIEGSPTTVFEQIISTTALGVITGGFFGVTKDTGRYIPLGLVKSDGEIKNRKYNWKFGGMIAASDNDVEIIPVRAYKDSPSRINVIQSKPLLIEEGRDGIWKSNFDRFDRSAIALTRHGEIVLFVIHAPGGAAASFAEFSQILLNYRTKNGNPIHYALAMDGGPGAHLFVPSLRKHCGVDTPNYIPNVVYLSK